MGAAWPPFNIWPIALVAPGIWLVSLRGSDRRHRFLLTMLFFTGAWSVAFHWNAMHPIPQTAITSVVALFAMICLISALVTVFSSTRISRNQITRLCGACLAVALFDTIMMVGPLPMPGTMIGLSLSSSAIGISWAPLVGSLGLSFIVLGVNLLLAGIILAEIPLVSTAIFITGLLFSPTFVDWDRTDGGREVAVTLVQPGISPSEWAEVYSQEKTHHLFQLALEARTVHNSTDLIVLPETALPVMTRSDLERLAASWSDSLDVAIIVGGISETLPGEFFNIAVASSPMGGGAYYEKRLLVPFAEQVPFTRYTPFFSRFQMESGGVSAYRSGSTPELFSFSGKRAGFLICFESFFPRDALAYRDLGADVLIVITQDGWWRSHAAKAQHFAYSRLMAASVGLPLIQSSVDGISGVINPDGSIQSVSESDTEEFILGRVPAHTIQTPYSRYGDIPILIFLFVCLLTLFMIERFQTFWIRFGLFN